MTTEITPNAIHTAGTPVPVERLAAMTTEEISNYFCEIKYFITSFEEELKNVKAELDGRTDRPAIFSTDHGFGGYKKTNGRAAYFIDPQKVVPLVTAEAFYKMVSITKTKLEENASPEAIATLKKNGGFTKTEGTPSVEYIKP